MRRNQLFAVAAITAALLSPVTAAAKSPFDKIGSGLKKAVQSSSKKHTSLPKPKIKLPKPKVKLPKPGIKLPKPGIKLPKPKINLPKPKIKLPKPKIKLPKPIIKLPKPIVRPIVRPIVKPLPKPIVRPKPGPGPIPNPIIDPICKPRPIVITWPKPFPQPCPQPICPPNPIVTPLPYPQPAPQPCPEPCPQPICEPVEPVETPVEDLPVIVAGARTSLPGSGYGTEPGSVVIKVGAITLQSQLETWEADGLVFLAPQIDLQEAVRATLCVLLADGNLYTEVPIALAPHQAEPQLPSVPVGSQLSLSGADLGTQPAQVQVKLPGLTLSASVVEWTPSTATVQLPQIDLAAATEARLVVQTADGREAELTRILLVPAA